MEKIAIIMSNIWIYRNQVVFRKNHPNFFLVNEKAMINFQNLQGCLIDSFIQNEGRSVLRVVEKWIRWIPPIDEIFKLNFDELKMGNKSASRGVINALMELLK